MTKRIYGKPICETDTASIMHPNEPAGSKGNMHTCPCCGGMCSNGDYAQAKYWSVVDNLYSVLTDDSQFSRNAAATDLIAMLNSEINTKVSRLKDDGSFSLDNGSAKVAHVNKMISKLLEFRE